MRVDEVRSTAGQARRRRGHRIGRLAWTHLRAAPASVLLAIVTIVTAALCGTLLAAAPVQGVTYRTWGAGVGPLIQQRHWWSPITSLFIPSDPVELVVGIVLFLVFFGIAERLMGTVRALIAFLVAGLLGVVSGVLVQWLGSLVQEWWATATSFDITLDPGIGIAGAVMAASVYAPTLWRRRLRVGVFAVLLMFVLYDGDSQNVYRLAAALFGLWLGTVFHPENPPEPGLRSSFDEARTLLATIVIASSLGPVIALVSQSENGLFYYLGQVFQRSIPDRQGVLDRCATAAVSECHHQIAVVNLYGAGSLGMTFVPIALLLVAAIGLFLGRRFALYLAIAVKLSLAVLGVFSFASLAQLKTPERDLWEYIVWGVSAVIVPAGIAVVLWLNRRYFRAHAPWPAVRDFLVTVLVALVVLTAVVVVVSLVNRASFVPDGLDLAKLPGTLPRRFVPAIFLGSFGETYIPGDALTRFVYQWTGVVFWAVFILSAIRLFVSTASARRSEDVVRARTLLRRGGGGTLAAMATWPGNTYWFAEDGSAVVAYRVVGRVAITLSDPICPDDRLEEAVTGFVRFCGEHGWVCVFYSVHGECLPVFDLMGWEHVPIGEETLLRPASLDPAGEPWRTALQTVNRGGHRALNALWTSWNELPYGMTSQIAAICEDWVAQKRLPEPGFMLGGLAEMKDADTALMLAVDPRGRVHGVTSWLPIHQGGAVTGWTLGVMRRAEGSPDGVTEFLVASAVLRVREDGAEVVSLPGAPLAGAPDSAGGAEPALLSRLADVLAAASDPADGFSSLSAFTGASGSERAALHMAYFDPLTLPEIGVAIARAYLPRITAREGVALARALV